MKSFAWLFAALLLAGCTSSSSAPPPTKSAVHFAGYPSATPSGKSILWYVQITNGGAAAAGPLTVAIFVLEYGTKDAGHDQKTVQTIAKDQTLQVNLQTQFFGFGDYDYTLEIRNADGTVAEKITSLYEYCGGAALC
ncbi:MAG: hypothetical protein ACYDCK_12175 [Thermoplasmatota archaeon]